jgi:hypothetical protein
MDTVEFFPQHVKMPHLSSYERDIQAARELMFALRNSAPVAPFSHSGHTQYEALALLATIFKEIAAPELQHAEQESQTEPPSCAPIAKMLPADSPSSIPSLITQPHSSHPRVDTPAPRVGQATLGVASPTTPKSHRRLRHNIKTPTTIPPFDLYKQQKQTIRPTPNKTRRPVPQRVVEYLGDTTRHIIADLQAETGIYYKTRSSARQSIVNVVTIFIPPTKSAIEAEYATHMANEIIHM